MKMFKSLSLCAVCCFLAALPQAKAASACAVATNVVTNCGFETGSFTSWTLTGNNVPLQLGNQYGVEGSDPIDGIAPHSGSSQAYFADLVANSTTLSQIITTVAGQSYGISFFLAQDTDPTSGGANYTNSFLASFGSTALATLSAVPVEGYTKYTYTAVATASTTNLSLTFGNDLGQFLVDDISVTAVPEPAALWLMVIVAAIALIFRNCVVRWRRG